MSESNEMYHVVVRTLREVGYRELVTNEEVSLEEALLICAAGKAFFTEGKYLGVEKE